MIETGEQAPDFALTDQDGEQLALSDLRGETVVVYFYPRADTHRTLGGKTLRLLERPELMPN